MRGRVVQNAALVEEASAASENMAEQAGLMNELMQFFATDGSVQSPVIHKVVADTSSPKNRVSAAQDGGWDEFQRMIKDYNVR